MKIKSPSLLFNSVVHMTTLCEVGRQTEAAATATDHASDLESAFRGGRRFSRSGGTTSILKRLQLVAFILLAFCINSIPTHAQISPPSRPILFVHGFCGSATDFGPLLGPLYQQLNSSLYPSSTLYYVQYDSVLKTTTFTDVSGNQIAVSSIPPNTRFFSIQLYDPIADSTDSNNVAKISILNKAYEISQVIKQITAITHVGDVIIVGHSMGGLDARAYVENLASPTGCYDYTNNTPYYIAPQCAPGSGNAAYANDVGDIVTVDTPHDGTPLAALSFGNLACFANSSTNKTELELEPAGGSGLIEALNYNGLAVANALPLKPNVTPIQAVEDYFTDINTAWDTLTGESDDVVQQPSQSIDLNVLPQFTRAPIKDVQIGYLSSDIGIASTPACWWSVPLIGNVSMLHLMPCLGNQPDTQTAIANQIYANEEGTLTSIIVQATYNGAPWTGTIQYQLFGPNGYWEPEITIPLTVSDLALGTYSLSNISGGPSGAGSPTVTASPSPTIQLGQWAATFTINFADKSLSSTTASTSATQINQGATVTLTAKVQSTAGTPTGTITFYDNGTTLSSITLDSSGTGTYSTTALPVGSDSITASYSGDANFSASTSLPTTVTVIASSLILPAPALTSPPNGGTNQSTTPVFIWSQVPNNSGYRIMVASSLAALPTDPNASSCLPVDSACVIDQAQSLTTGINYYSPPSGLLMPGSTYYWQVHARASAPYLPGYWSVASFSTSSGVQPPVVNTGAAASVTTTSATLTGTVNPNGLDTHSYFLFGTSSVLSGAIQTPSQDLGSGNTSSGLDANISGLTAGTQYYFQLVGSNNSGTSKGAINTFTTSNGSQAVLTINNSVGGAIFSTDEPIECSSGSTCTYPFPSGTAVTIYALPTPGWFATWSGCDLANGAYCTLTVSLSRTVSITYGQQPLSTLTLQSSSPWFSSAIGVQSQVGQVFITNSGSSELNPITVAITGANAANFNETNNCPSYGLNAGNECIASVTFTPNSIGDFSAWLSVSSSNAVTSPVLMFLNGTGISGSLITPTVQVTPLLTSISTSQALTVTVAVAGGSGNPAPTGTVTLISGNYTSQPTQLSNGSTTINVPAGALSVGTDLLTAAYQGDNNYSSQNGTNSVIVTGAQISCESYSSASQITGITQPLRLGFGNGKLVAGGVGQAYIVDPTSSQITTVPFTQYSGGFAGKVSVINSQAFIPISNLSQGEVAVLNLGTATVSQYWQVGVEPYGSLVAGNELYIGDSVLSSNGSPSQVYVINPASGQIVTSINAGQVIQSLASDPVHNTIYALNYNDATASVIDLGSSAVIATIPLGIMPTSGIVVNNKLLVVGDVPRTQQGEIVEVDTSSHTVEGAMLAVGRDPFEIVAVNGCAFVPSSSDSTVSIVDLASNDIVKTISSGIGQDPTGAAVDPSSGNVYIANQIGNSISVLTPGSASTPTITVTPSAASITTAQPLTVTVVVNGGTGSPTPTGVVIITSGSYTSTTNVLSEGSTTIIIPAGSLSTGSDTLAVSYTPDSSSSSRYNASSGAASVTVTTPSKTTPTLTVTPSASSITTTQPLTVTVSANGGNGNPTPTGSVTLSGGGYTSAATTLSGGGATINIPANSLSVGTDSLVVSYTPDSPSSSTYNSASGSASVTVTTPAKTTPTVAVTPSGSSITTTQPLTVTVSVNGGNGNPTPTGSVILSGGGYTSAAITLSGGGATINIPANSLSAGTDSLTVSYTPDSSSSSIYNSAAGANSVTVTQAKSTPTVTVTPSASSITTAQPLTVTVAVNGGSSNPTPTGSVTLTGGGYTSAAIALSSGSATINIPANSLSAGTDSLAVSYTPDSSSSSTYNSASGSVTVTVTTPAKTTPTVTVTPSASSITTTQALSVTVTMAGTPTPTGSVTLSGGGYTSAATTLSGGSATINIPAGSLSTGTDTLIASYTPDSNSSSTYNSASGSATVTVTTPAKITPMVTVTPSSSSITTAQPLTVAVAVNGGTGNLTPTGTVTLSGGGYTSAAATLSSGSAAINIPANSLSAGSDSLAVTYTPDSSSSSTFNSATGSATVTVTTPTKTTPTVTVTPSASTITTAQPLTVAVSVNGGTGNPTPTGTVTLSSGSYSAQQTLASGTASFNIAAGTLGNGANTLTASYSGDATYTVASSTTTVTVEPVSISTTAPSPVNPGSSTTSTVTLTGSGGYSGTMNLSCSLTSSPSGGQSLPTCVLNPTSVTIASGGSGTSTLTVNTTAASTTAQARPTDQHLWKLGGGGAVLAALLFFGIPFRRRGWTSMLALLFLVAAAGAIGCGGGGGTSGGGGGGSSTPATTAGNYSFTVAATDSVNSKITTSTTVTITVQ